jgi:hypothetical protein
MSGIVADGSAAADADELIEIDRSDAAQRWRWRCPNGHTDWSPTNNHLWCKGCLRAHEGGADVDPEHYELVDAQTGEPVSWSAVRLVESEPQPH